MTGRPKANPTDPNYFAGRKLFIRGGTHSQDATEQAIGELRGYANALRQGNAGLSAAQLDWCLDIATLYVREHPGELTITAEE